MLCSSNATSSPTLEDNSHPLKQQSRNLAKSKHLAERAEYAATRRSLFGEYNGNVVPLLAFDKGYAAMPVAMELSRIIISEINDQQVIYLKEIDGARTFPILIGIFEATSIDRRVKGFEAPRPLTHDLLVQSVEALGGEFPDVVISGL